MPFSVLNSIFSENALIVVKQQQPACRPPRSALLRKPAPGSPPVHTTPTQYALTSALILVFTPSPHRFVPEFTNTHTHTHYSPAPEVMIFSRGSTRNSCKAPGRVLHTMRLPRTTLLARSPRETNPANDAVFRSELDFQ